MACAAKLQQRKNKLKRNSLTKGSYRHIRVKLWRITRFGIEFWPATKIMRRYDMSVKKDLLLLFFT